MRNVIDRLMTMSCKQFSRAVASDEKPKGFYARLQFWTHWVICEFCRRYWKEIKRIGHLHRKNSTLTQYLKERLPEFKTRLRERLSKRPT